MPERELTTRDEACLGRPELDGSAALPPTPYSVDAAPNGECPNAEPKGAAAPTELGVRDWQTKLFMPARRQPARDLVIGAGPPSEIYSAFKRLRNQIIKRLQENGWTTVAITSPSRVSGTTLTAINLAISIARDFSYTVLLVELDLVNPTFREVLGFKQRQGIVDHLLRDVPIAEILSLAIHGLNSSSTTAKIRGLRKFGATGAPESANNFSIISRRSFATRKTIRIF